MRIAFTVLANTELSSTRVTKIKVTWRSKKRLPITTKGRDVVHKTQNKKLYNIEPSHRQTGVPFCGGVLCLCVRICVSVYTVLYKR